jgi:hypothetical protein
MLKFFCQKFEQFGTAAQLAHCNLVCAAPRLLHSDLGRFLMLMTFGAIASLMLIDTAAAQGIAGMVETGARQADRVKAAASRIFGAGGLLAGGYGGYNWYKKGKEGENSRISGGQITVPILAGAGLGAISYLLKAAAQTVGIPITP